MSDAQHHGDTPPNPVPANPVPANPVLVNPVLVDVTRDPAPGTFVESIHRGAIAVVDGFGHVVTQIGDVERPICPRSTLKPLQALAFLESGAIETFGLGEAEIALATASHNGEPMHTDAVAAWLRKIDCSVDDLECGADLPMHTPSAQALLRAGDTPSALHNTCSGKHAGFLSLARTMGVDIAGYTRADHPVQKRVAATLSEMLDYDVTSAPVGDDGCGAPNYAMALKTLAHGLARMARTQSLAPARASGVTTLLNAVQAHPLLLAGTDRPCSLFMENLKTPGLVKSGAEGVFGAILPSKGSRPALGLALKIDDGGERAADCAMTWALSRLGVLERGAKPIEDLALRPLTNVNGTRVGTIGPSKAWENFDFGV